MSHHQHPLYHQLSFSVVVVVSLTCFSSPSPVTLIQVPPLSPPLVLPLLKPLLALPLDRVVLLLDGLKEWVAGRFDKIGFGGLHALLSSVDEGPVISGYLQEGGEKSFQAWVN